MECGQWYHDSIYLPKTILSVRKINIYLHSFYQIIALWFKIDSSMHFAKKITVLRDYRSTDNSQSFLNNKKSILSIAIDLFPNCNPRIFANLKFKFYFNPICCQLWSQFSAYMTFDLFLSKSCSKCHLNIIWWALQILFYWFRGFCIKFIDALFIACWNT